MEKLALTVFVIGLFYSGNVVMGATSKDSDSYMDTVISSNILPEIKSSKLDPTPLPNFDTSFKDTFLRIKVNVKANYTKGTLTGLSTLKNLGNCSAPANSLYGNTTLSCNLGFKDLEMNYESKVKYGRVPSVTVKSAAKVTGTVIAVEVTTSPAKNIPHLLKFDVRVVGVITPKFTGLGPLNRYLKMMTDTFLRSATTYFMNVLENKLKPAIANNVGKVTMPLA